MIRGIYTSTNVMSSHMTRLSKVANNMANLDTPGFKRDLLTESTALGKTGSGANSAPEIIGAGFDPSQGNLAPTNSTWDLALSGPGYFVVDKAGQTYYTRNGRFNRSPEGNLVTDDGGLVMGDGGRMSVPAGEATVGKDGTVQVDGRTVGKLTLADFAEGVRLTKVGSTYMDANGTQPVAALGTVVSQGHLEESNVDLVQEMIEMMTVTRTYEANQRLLRYQDETLSQAVTEVGKLA